MKVRPRASGWARCCRSTCVWRRGCRWTGGFSGQSWVGTLCGRVGGVGAGAGAGAGAGVVAVVLWEGRASIDTAGTSAGNCRQKNRAGRQAGRQTIGPEIGEG